MRRILLVVFVLAMLAAVGGQAQADPSGNETCGGQALQNRWDYNTDFSGEWTMFINWNCGTDKTFTWEFQKTTNGGANAWDYLGEFGFRSPAGCNTGCGAWFHYPAPCVRTGSYRARVNWNGASQTSAWVGAGVVCDGNVFTN